MFLLFGYVNGTDDYINISKYINENIYNNNNSVLDLTENAVIDNNIFGYEILRDQIKLAYIPEFLLFYNKSSENKRLKNGDILDKNYILKNIGNSNNNNNNYLEFQIVLTEADYDIFNSLASSIVNCTMNNTAFIDEREFYNKKIFYGRANTLTFIESTSCFEYCLTCRSTGSDIHNQKCLSCKEDYTYFYPKNFSMNCIPEGKFYDFGIKRIIDCNDTNSKFYIEDSGKRICFKNDQNCPEEYPYLISETNECRKTIETETNAKIEVTILKNQLNEETSLIHRLNENCTVEKFIKGNCTIIFYDNEEAYNFILEVLKKYEKEDEKSLYLNTKKNLSFELTTCEREKNELNGILIRDNLTILDIDKCETILRDTYNLSENTSLIFLKSENLYSIPSEKNVQYEVYESLNKTRLNLNFCKGININLYFPIELSSYTEQLYEDLQSYGYDLFNIKDRFYQDICTPYDTKNGTDIILSDRINDIYYKNNNLTLCQENCEYSDYIPEKKMLKCKCDVNWDSIDYADNKKFTPKKIYESFYDVLKYSNYKIMKCYKLIFKNNPVKSNIGSIFVIIFFIIYSIFLVVFFFQGVSSLKIDIIKSIFNNQWVNHQNIKSNFNNNINSNIRKGYNKLNNRSNSFHSKSSRKTKILFPPKRKNIKNKTNRNFKKNKYNVNNISIVDNKIQIIKILKVPQ